MIEYEKWARHKQHPVPFVKDEGEQRMKIMKDGNGSPYIEWAIDGKNITKRAWIQDRSGNPDKDWAGTGRYLNVVRVDGPNKGPAGNATDFPIYSKLASEDILKAFVIAVNGITGVSQ